MNKKGLIGFIIFLLIFFTVMVLGLFAASSHHNKIQSFCENNGFETYEEASWKWEDSFCIKIENNTRIEKQIDRCGNRWCFVFVEVGE